MAEQKIVWLEDRLANAKDDEERLQILIEWEKEKSARSARKEEERINAPSMIDKFLDGVAALKKKMFKAKAKDKKLSQTQQHTR